MKLCPIVRPPAGSQAKGRSLVLMQHLAARTPHNQGLEASTFEDRNSLGCYELRTSFDGNMD